MFCRVRSVHVKGEEKEEKEEEEGEEGEEVGKY